MDQYEVRTSCGEDHSRQDYSKKQTDGYLPLSTWSSYYANLSLPTFTHDSPQITALTAYIPLSNTGLPMSSYTGFFRRPRTLSITFHYRVFSTTELPDVLVLSTTDVLVRSLFRTSSHSTVSLPRSRSPLASALSLSPQVPLAVGIAALTALSDGSLLVATKNGLVQFSSPDPAAGTVLTLENQTSEEISENAILQGLCEMATLPSGEKLVFAFFFDGDTSIQAAIVVGNGAKIVGRRPWLG